MGLEEKRRKEIVGTASIRILKNIDSLKGYERQMYMEKLLGMLGDMELIALDFSIAMTPELPQENKEK